VVLPAPFSPHRPSTVPAATSAVSPRSTESAPNCFSTPCKARALVMIGDRDSPGDNLSAHAIDHSAPLGREPFSIVIILGELQSALFETEPAYPADKLTAEVGFDRVEHCRVDALDHAGEDQLRGLVGLIGIDADGELVGFACGLKDAEASRAGGVKNHVG